MKELSKEAMIKELKTLIDKHVYFSKVGFRYLAVVHLNRLIEKYRKKDDNEEECPSWVFK